jgi:hypothetical protein
MDKQDWRGTFKQKNIDGDLDIRLGHLCLSPIY